MAKIAKKVFASVCVCVQWPVGTPGQYTACHHNYLCQVNVVNIGGD